MGRDLWRETFGERPLERDLWRDTLPGSDTRLLDFFPGSIAWFLLSILCEEVRNGPFLRSIL